MTTKAVASSKHAREQDASNKTFTQSNSLWRLLYFIKHSDWDDEILAQEEWLDKVCIGVIGVAALSLIPPALVLLFMR